MRAAVTCELLVHVAAGGLLGHLVLALALALALASVLALRATTNMTQAKQHGVEAVRVVAVAELVGRARNEWRLSWRSTVLDGEAMRDVAASLTPFASIDTGRFEFTRRTGASN